MGYLTSLAAWAGGELAEDGVDLSMVLHWLALQGDAYLERVKHASENRHLRGRIEAYQRSLVYITVVGYLARDQIEHARAVARLLERPRLDRASIAAFLLKLPKPLLRAGLSVRKWLRRKTMSFRPR